MRINFQLIISFILVIFITECTGYKPIFNSENLQFEIAEYELSGNKILGKQIYSQLDNLSEGKKNDKKKRSIILKINTKKIKNPTVKDSSGKIQEYKIILDVNLEVINYLTNAQIFKQSFINSTTYEVQSEISESIKLENQSLNDLVDKSYKDILIRLIESLN